MKAVDKDRTRRYDSAAALAADVQRYLRTEPVLAGPPTRGYRLRRFARRNRVGLAVTAVAITFVSVLCAGVGWVVRDRAVRHAGTERRIEDSLQAAVQLRDQKKWPEARAAAQQVRVLLAMEGEYTELRNRLDGLTADLDMVDRLEQIRLSQTVVKKNTWDRAGAGAGYAAAFRDYGVDVTALPPDAAAGLVRASLIHEELVAALDDWLAILPANERARREQVRAVVSRADDDAWRGRFRDPATQRNRDALVELAGQPVVTGLPPQSAVLLGRALREAGAAERAVAVLSAAQRRFPADVWLNMELAKTLRWSFQPPRLDEAAGYCRAALAVRPNSAGIYSGLGASLHTPAHLDEAIAAYQRAIELEPEFVDPRNALAHAMGMKGRWDEAIAHYSETLRLNPRFSYARYHLAAAYRCAGAWDKAIAEYRGAIRDFPKDKNAYRELAFLLANCTDVRLRDTVQALEAAHKAVQMAPGDPPCQLVLGSAHFRAGNWEQAVAALERSNASPDVTPAGSAYAGVFLAMAHAKRGDPDRANASFARVARWMQENRRWIETTPIVEEELPRLLAESAELLSIEQPLASVPKPLPK
jgi:tetratricopeptide (TPR) repeat protein